jgi:hypothetical protein
MAKTPKIARRTTRPLTIGLAFAAALAIGPAAHAAVTLKIKNNSGQQVWVMWTGTSSLTGSGGTVTTSIANSDYGNNAAGYPLTAFALVGTNEYQINGFSMGGGRMWFTYGPNSWTFSNTGYTPALATFSDPNFTTRYDKIEASITGSANDNLDITAVDGFSIPFFVTGYNSANPSTTTQTLKGSIAQVVANALGAIAANPNAPPAYAPSGDRMPLLTGNSPYLVINSNSLGASTASPFTFSPVGSTGNFVRVIANDQLVTAYPSDPVAYVNSGVPANYNWASYATYVKRMDGSGVPIGIPMFSGATTLAGSFVGVPSVTSALTTPATYSLQAKFNASEPLSVGYTQPGTGPGTGPFTINFTGVVTLSGTSTIASGTYAGTYNIVIKIPYGGAGNYTITSGFAYPYSFMLDPSGIVGANANYLYKFYLSTQPDPGFTATNPFSGGPQNDILTQIMGDLFAGMNVGAAGSDKSFTSPVTINGNRYPAGTKVGTYNSQDWFSLGSVLSASNGGSVYDYYFGYLQPSPLYYNQYAETIYPFTDAYGFAYSDRIQGGRVAIAWDATKSNAIDTIEITILPDTGAAQNPGRVHPTEYHNATLDHYFVTHSPDEMAKLDAGTQIKGWKRTGRTLAAYPSAQAGTTPVCRYRIPPGSGDSHFFGRNPEECDATAASHPDFVLEDPAMMHMVMPTQGVCPAKTSPVYRVYNNRASANHRYVNDLATRSQMVARGWIAEGDGPDRVTLCAPL